MAVRGGRLKPPILLERLGCKDEKPYTSGGGATGRRCIPRRAMGSLSLSLSLSLVILLLSVRASAQTSLAGCGGSGGAQGFEIGVRNENPAGLELGVKVIDMTHAAFVDARPVVESGPPFETTGCGWVAHVGEPVELPNRVQLYTATLYRIGIWSGWPPGCTGQNCTGTYRVGAYEYALNRPGYPTGSGFYFPRGDSGGKPDLLFFVGGSESTNVRVFPTALGNAQSGHGVDDFFADDNWILPYDVPTICAATGCDPENDGNYIFLTPVRAFTSTFPRQYTTTAGADWRVPVGRTYTWSGSDVSELRFGTGGRITAKGTFHASGMTFTASNPSLGWLGLYYIAGSGGSLSGVTLSRVGSNEPLWAGSAVEITNASPTLTDVRIENAASAASAGVGVAGPSEAPVITRLTAVNLTDGAVGVGGDARADIVRGTMSSNGFGISASGTGSVAYLVPDWQDGNFRGPLVTGNNGLGVLATSSAEVRFGAPSPQHGLTSVSGNSGRGLTATTGGALYAGTATVYQRNRFFLNGGSNATGNVKSSGSGSRAYVQCAWWNTPTPTSSDFRAGTSGGGTLVLTTYLTADPYLVANPPCVSTLPSEESRSAGRMAHRSDAGTSSSLGGDALLTDRLLAALDASTPADAVVALSALIADAPESDEAAAALAELGSIAARADAPPSATAALDAATTHARKPLRIAAWQALVASRAATGDAAGAFSATDALMPEGAVVAAEAARVYLHGAAGDMVSAVAALERLEAAAPGSLEAAVARAYLGMGPDPFGDDVRTAEPEGVHARSGEASAVAFAVSPNPASTTATLTLTLDAAADVRLTVYDLLGRVVAEVPAGALEAGTHRAEVPVSALAPGTYVVRATVQGEGGAVVQTARLTVAR